MPKNLAQAVKQVDVTEIVRHGEALTVPENMSIDNAIDLLHRRQEFEEEPTAVKRDFNVFPWDGAFALSKALESKFGWAAAQSTPSFFGDQPPKLIDIEIDYGVKTQVAWGRFGIPTLSYGFVECDVARNRDGQLCFSLYSKVLRKDEKVVLELFEEIEKLLEAGSIYAGKAFKIRFRDDNGHALSMPSPEFLRTDHVNKDMLIYNDEVMDAIQTNLFTPIERIQDCIANDVPVKRGVLLGGAYGTGKTLAATVASRLAVDNNVTYLYVPRADELGDAIAFAKQYQSTACVIFCEDIDRAINGERSVEMDDILNILDGIDTKGNKIITVLTTNHLENINPAMLRPGRLDAVIDVEKPNASAIAKLIHLYGKGTVDPTADLSEVGQTLEGVIPAVVAEVVKRAKLAQLNLQPAGTQIQVITSEALLSAAVTMRKQVDALAALNKPKEEPMLEDLLGQVIENKLEDKLEKVESRITSIYNEVC